MASCGTEMTSNGREMASVTLTKPVAYKPSNLNGKASLKEFSASPT